MPQKSKPTRMKQLEGNPGKKAMPKIEPQPEALSKLPDPPEYLGEIGRQEWRERGSQLLACGLLTEIDLPAFAAYCRAHERWVIAERRIEENGEILMTTNGNVIQSPYVGMANKAWELRHKALTDFGMNPSARSKVSVNPQKPKGKFGEYGVVQGGKR